MFGLVWEGGEGEGDVAGQVDTKVGDGSIN